MNPAYNSPLIVKLREQCLRRGAAGIKGIGRMWRQFDNNNNGRVCLDEFVMGIKNHNIDFTTNESVLLFSDVDQDGSGNFHEFNVI